VIEGGKGFYCRLGGTDIVNQYSYEMTGKHVSRLTEEIRGTILWNYREVMQRQEPIFIQRNYVYPGWECTKIIKLLLPLSRNGVAIIQLFSCFNPVC
jgi:hypothetical protein